MKKKVYRELYGEKKDLGMIAGINIGFLEADIQRTKVELENVKEDINKKKKTGRKKKND